MYYRARHRHRVHKKDRRRCPARRANCAVCSWRARSKNNARARAAADLGAVAICRVLAGGDTMAAVGSAAAKDDLSGAAERRARF